VAAERFWSQSLPLRERLLGPDHPDLATTLNNLARVLVEQRKFAAAEPLLTRAVNIYLKQRDETHDDLAFFFSNLALAKAGLGKSAEAQALFERALRAAEAHQTRARAPVMVDLANLRCASGDFAGAMALLDRAAPIMKTDYGNDAWRSAWVDNSLGACLLRQGRIREAKSLIDSTSATILKRWPAQSLYGLETVRRQRLLSAKLDA
jgi:tetratricopeptide (TPR) repeat protein